MARQRSMWTGSISFGLVNVPVSLITATRDRGLHFHQIHDKTHERLSVSYVCTKEDAPVDYSEIAHGFDTGKGYVMLTDDELVNLVLNILVAAIGSLQFWRAGYFSWRLFWPFVPTGDDKERDNARELELKAQLEKELPIEPDITRWFGTFDAPV